MSEAGWVVITGAVVACAEAWIGVNTVTMLKSGRTITEQRNNFMGLKGWLTTGSKPDFQWVGTSGLVVLCAKLLAALKTVSGAITNRCYSIFIAMVFWDSVESGCVNFLQNACQRFPPMLIVT